MTEPSQRRLFLKFLAAFIGGGYVSLIRAPATALAAGSETQGALSSPELDALTAYAHTLLPVLEPTHARYSMVAQKLAQLAALDPDMGAFIHGGIEVARIPDRATWSGLTATDRAEIVARQEGTPFFGFLRWTTTEIVMREPELWQRLGYEGSAIEHGGYLQRGFDDIDWLPQAETERMP